MTDIAGIDVARIEIRLAEATARTRPGSIIEHPVTLVNLTPLPDFFYLAVSGNPAPWVTFDKESVNLFPNWSDIVNMTVTVPEETKPGSYLLEIEASSHTQDNVKSSIHLEIIVEGASGSPAPVHPTGVNPASFENPVSPSGNLTGTPGPNPANFQPGSREPFAGAPDFSRLQIDLDFGQLTVQAGQTTDQTVYLLNQSAGLQTFSLGLDGLPPDWITLDPPYLRLSPNWSEVARFKIAVPADAIPGRYLLTVKAVPESLPEAVAWRQFDIVILPAASQVPPSAPDHIIAQAQPGSPQVETASQFVSETSHLPGMPVMPVQPDRLPGGPLPSQPSEAQPAMPPAPPAYGQSAPPAPVWNQPAGPAPAPVAEAPKPTHETRQKGGLFGWRKKKAEPVTSEPVLFVPIIPAEPAPAITPALPVETQAAPEPPTQAAVAPATPDALPETDSEPNAPIEDDSPTRQMHILPATPTPVSEAEEVSPPIGEDSVTLPSLALETMDAPAINPPLGEEPTVNPQAVNPELSVNPPIDDTPTIPPAPQAGLETETTLVAAQEKEPAQVAPEGEALPGEEETAGPTTPTEPAVVRNENIELNVENVKIRFELGNSYEQQVGLINLMGTPAFFELKVEGIPETWYNFSYSQINLFPNWREQVYFRLEAPTDTVPGLFQANLVVASPNLPGNRVEVPFEIEVLPSAVLADKIYRATGAGQPVKIPTDAKIELVVNTANLSLEPDGNLEQIISLVNHSPIPDLFELKLEGLLETWYQFSTPQVNLFPNWQEELYLRVALPSNAVPGLYPIRVEVTGQQYPELHAEQALLLQVLPPAPKPVPAEEVNPVIGAGGSDDITVSRRQTGTVSETETASASEEDSSPAQPFSFASFFQQQNFTPGAVSENPAPAPASNLPVVPAAPEINYNQATSANQAPGAPEIAPAAYNDVNAPVTESGYASAPYPGPLAAGAAPAGNPFEERQTSKMGQPYVLAPQTSLAGIIPVISAQPEAPVPPPPPVEPAPLPVTPPRKRTFWQKITGQGKEPPAPVTPKIDENVLWRTAQPPAQAPAKAPAQNAPAPSTSSPVASQATQVNWSMPANQSGSAAEYPAIGGSAPTAQAGQRSYTPISTGGDVARVQITLEKPHMTIVAGQSETQQIFLMNMTSLPDNFELNIEGLPGNWFSFENTTVNLFPNWNEHTALTMNISEKVKPDLYKGRIVATAKAQTGVRAIMPIEVEVLAPLVVQARLQPHRAKGYKADFEILLRNRSMSEGRMAMQWAPTNTYSMGTFTPPQVVLAPGQSQHVKVQVMLRKKTPSDQARQAQPFKVLVQPQWTVAQVPVLTAPVSVDGEYIHRSRWVFIQRHPVLFTFLTILLLIVLLWNLLLLPFIQNTLMAMSLDKVTYSDIAAKTLVADQIGFNQKLKDANPFAALVQTDVSFVEAPDKNPKGVVVVRMQAFVFTGPNAATIEGSLQVDPVSGDLKFVAKNPSQLGSFPWFFIPPDKVVQKLNAKLKTWLSEQNPAQRLDDVYIEGNTLFLKLRNCQPGEIACKT